MSHCTQSKAEPLLLDCQWSHPLLEEAWADALALLAQQGFANAVCFLRHERLANDLCVLRSETTAPIAMTGAVQVLPTVMHPGAITVALSADGTAGWLLTPAEDGVRMRQERKVAAKRIAIQSYALFMRILDDQLASEAGPKSLSRREKECLTLLAKGMRTQRIAEQIAISPATVEFHFKNARRKLGALTREQALAISVQNGWVQV